MTKFCRTGGTTVNNEERLDVLIQIVNLLDVLLAFHAVKAGELSRGYALVDAVRNIAAALVTELVD